MSSLYFHIPFCHKACSYCSFYFVVSPRRLDEFVDSLLLEILLRKNELQTPIQTIYFGGGTPSMLKENHWERLFEAIYTHFYILPNAEITTEANPEDLSIEYCQMLRKIGFNRLSIGIQSWKKSDLIAMGRNHNFTIAAKALKNAAANFENLSIDLMFNLPNQTRNDWQQNLETTLQYPIKHISTYNLTIEEKTKLYRQVKKGEVNIPPDDNSVELYQYTMDYLAQKGFLHYEISNFGQANYECKHNLNYWNGSDYLGFGPSAHSAYLSTRIENTANLKKYIDSLKRYTLAQTKEELTVESMWNEFVLTRLRMKEGIAEAEINSKFGPESFEKLKSKLALSISQHLVSENHHSLALTQKGKFFADQVAMEAME